LLDVAESLRPATEDEVFAMLTAPPEGRVQESGAAC
jgi:hypothetical protein